MLTAALLVKSAFVPVRHQVAEVAFIFERTFSSVTVIQLLDPFLIGIQLFPLHADPVQIEIDFKKKTTYSAVGVVKRMDLDKLLVKFNGLIYRLICMKDKVRDCTLHLCVDSLGWGTLKLLSRPEQNNAVFRVVSLSIRSSIGEDVFKKVAMKNTGEVNEEFLAFLGIKSSQLTDKSFRI